MAEVLRPNCCASWPMVRGSSMSTRLADMAALGRAALVDVRTSPASAELRFAAGDGVRRRVEAIVAAESECCAFLTMRIGDGADVVVLSIEAPPGAELVLDEMVAAFQAEAQNES